MTSLHQADRGRGDLRGLAEGGGLDHAAHLAERLQELFPGAVERGHGDLYLAREHLPDDVEQTLDERLRDFDLLLAQLDDGLDVLDGE